MNTQLPWNTKEELAQSSHREGPSSTSPVLPPVAFPMRLQSGQRKVVQPTPQGQAAHARDTLATAAQWSWVRKRLSW